MAQGLQIYDAAGNLIVDATHRLGRILGVVSVTAGANSSTTDAGLSTGTPFWIFVPTDSGGPFYAPHISVSGTTLSWVFNYGGAANGKILYGVF